MAVKLKGKTAIWGVKTEEGDTFASATIQTQSVTTTSEQEPMPNNDGETTGLALFDERNEVQIEVLVEAGTPAPEHGADIQIAGVDCICLNAETLWEARGWKKLRIQATGWTAFGEGEGEGTPPPE